MKDTPNPIKPRISASGRRTFSKEFKQQVVMQSLEPGASVSRVARAHDINNNQLFKWRKELGGSLVPGKSAPVELLAVTLTPHEGKPACDARVAGTPQQGTIEIAFNSARLVVHGNVDLEALRVVMQCMCR